MRALVCHVRYSQPGGEDSVFRAETALLRDGGLTVDTLDLSSDDFRSYPVARRARMALTYEHHEWGRRLIREAIVRHRPDVVHFHNLYPTLGPAAIVEADHLGCATVQTLHNYRLSCLNGLHVREGRFCADCSPGRFAAGVSHGCYRGSRVQSLLTAHATAHQWRSFVTERAPTLWLALTPFMKQVYVECGAPAGRVVVKANSVIIGKPGSQERDGVLCAGRLSPEKGILALMRTWPADGPVLTVAGAGPLEPAARGAVRRNVRFLGRLDPDDVRAALRAARALVMPSIWPEGLPLIALEAFAEGTPVVSFDRWAVGEVVREVSPRCVVPYPEFVSLATRAADVAAAADWQTLSERCVSLWRTKYGDDVNRVSLTEAYELALALKHGRNAS
jgi:glycosyltransferase involved in cell wall biosynthesis